MSCSSRPTRRLRQVSTKYRLRVCTVHNWPPSHVVQWSWHGWLQERRDGEVPGTPLSSTSVRNTTWLHPGRLACRMEPRGKAGDPAKSRKDGGIKGGARNSWVTLLCAYCRVYITYLGRGLFYWQRDAPSLCKEFCVRTESSSIDRRWLFPSSTCPVARAMGQEYEAGVGMYVSGE